MAVRATDPRQISLFEPDRHEETSGPGAKLLPEFAQAQVHDILATIEAVAAAAPFRHLTVPSGHAMSVAITNCGAAGWISDRHGYRYESADPDSGLAWPAMPRVFRDLAQRAATAAGYSAFDPNACLINRYVPGARMGLHQDKDEAILTAPIVSVSLGLPAIFLWGGLARTDKVQRLPLWHGDVLVWGGPSRMAYHGVDPLKDGDHPLTGALRYNLTFRRAF